jgi:hypothetical protein
MTFAFPSAGPRSDVIGSLLETETTGFDERARRQEKLTFPLQMVITGLKVALFVLWAKITLYPEVITTKYCMKTKLV